MKHDTINEYIAEVLNGTMTADEAARDMFPKLSYAVEYYSPAQGEWDAYQGIRRAYQALTAATPKQDPRKPDEVEMVACKCGHTVPRSLVMSASMGSSCPDCYDRMSN